ncbi:MAG: penicillin-binding protein 1C [Beijerinckiaceae bacterium]
MKRRWRILAGTLAFAAFAPPAALLAVGLSLPPLDLSGTAERSPVVLDRKGEVLRAFTMADGRWRMPTTVADVDPRFVDMLIAYEDRRFRRHAGIDAIAMLRAAGQAIRHGRIVSGGSTLTMQVARLVEPRDERSLGAKLRQMVRAIQLERRFSKDEILGLYFSLAPYGGNIEGVRAASFAWFGRDARRLSSGEAALLAALPQAPEARRPDRAADHGRRGRARLLAMAVAAGLMTEDERAQALAERLPTGRQPFPMLAAHAAETALRERPEARTHRLTLDAGWQRQLEALARERAEALGPKLAVAMVAIEHATGEVRALVAGGDYFADERAGALDLTRALRSPGSALKPFIYALAFEEGIAHPATVLEDRPGRHGLYAPENFDLTFQGTVTAKQALQMSLNVPAVDLLAAVGPQRLLSRLRQGGLPLALPPEGAPGLAIGLGGAGVTLRDLTTAYAALARGGETPPFQLRNDAGAPDAPAARLTEPVAAWYVADALLGAPAPLHGTPGRIAFKTGTSYGYRDAWSVGFDRRHAIGVWVGRPDNAAVPGLTGRAAAAPILFDAFSRIGLEPGVGPMPEGAITTTSGRPLPPPLRRFMRTREIPFNTASQQTPLRVAFPPDGAQLELPEGVSSIPLKLTGGTPPFTAYVDGSPLLNGSLRRQDTLILPDQGTGFVRISIVDIQGATDSVSIRLRK